MNGVRPRRARWRPDDDPVAKGRERVLSASATLAGAPEVGARLAPAVVSRLQRSAGNQAVQRLLAPERTGLRPRPVADRRLPTPSRTVSAGAALGQSRPTVQRGCGGKNAGAALPPAHQAKAIIRAAHMPLVLETRALAIIDDPDIIQQGAFGICAIVSILRHVVRNDPVTFAEMTVQAIADGSNTADRMPAFNARASRDQKRDHAELEYLVAHWFVRHGKRSGKKAKQLVRRGKRDKSKSKPYKKVYGQQKAFSDQFNGKDGIVNWKTEGHFGMTGGGLNYLLGKVNKGKSTKIRVTNIVTDYASARAFAGATGSVFASITSAKFYTSAKSPVTKLSPGAGGVKFVHWIMLEDIRDAGTDVDIDLWTWGDKHHPKVAKGAVNSYFYSLVAAKGT